MALASRKIEWLDARQILVPTLQPEELSRLFEAVARKAETLFGGK
jgi:hypothetical protein